LIELNRDALLKSFWWKNSFIKFLRRMPISEYTLTSFRQDESKRVWLDLRFGLDPEGVGVRFQPVQQPREGVMGRGLGRRRLRLSRGRVVLRRRDREVDVMGRVDLRFAHAEGQPANRISASPNQLGVTAFPALIFERICPTGISDRRDELLEACDFSLQRKWFPRFLDS